jgi:hypothetical protein
MLDEESGLAQIFDGNLIVFSAGIVELRATIANGLAQGTDFTQHFNIIVSCAGQNHDWDEWEEIEPATCEEDGEEESVCKICGDIRTRAIPQLTGDDCPTFIRDRQTNNARYGILLENAIVSDLAKILVITPESATITIRIFDALGNVVWTTTDVGANHHLPIIWDLRNSAGREVASGTYLIIVEATGISGRRFTYSTRLGVSR